MHVTSFFSFLGSFSVERTVCDLGGSSITCGDGEDKCVRNPWGIISDTLRQYWCGMLRGEYVKISIYLYLGFLCIHRLSWSDFLVGVYLVGVVLHVSPSLWGVFWHCHWLVVWLFTVSHYLLALYLLVTVELSW